MAEGLPSGSPIDREIAVAPTDTDVALPYRVGHLAAEVRPGITRSSRIDVIENLDQGFQKIEFTRAILADEDVDETVILKGNREIFGVLVVADPD